MSSCSLRRCPRTQAAWACGSHCRRHRPPPILGGVRATPAPTISAAHPGYRIDMHYREGCIEGLDSTCKIPQLAEARPSPAGVPRELSLSSASDLARHPKQNPALLGRDLSEEWRQRDRNAIRVPSIATVTDSSVLRVFHSSRDTGGATAEERGQALASPHSRPRDAPLRFRPQTRACSCRNPLASNDLSGDTAARGLPHLSRDRWRGARHRSRSCHSMPTTLGWFSHGLSTSTPNGLARSPRPTWLSHASNCWAGIENIVCFC